MHQYPLYFSSYGEIEPLCCALGFPIRDRNLSDSRSASREEKENIQTREKRSDLSSWPGRQWSPVFVKFTVSGLSWCSCWQALGKDKGEIALLFQVQVEIIAFYLILLGTGTSSGGRFSRKGFKYPNLFV